MKSCVVPLMRCLCPFLYPWRYSRDMQWVDHHAGHLQCDESCVDTAACASCMTCCIPAALLSYLNQMWCACALLVLATFCRQSCDDRCIWALYRRCVEECVVGGTLRAIHQLSIQLLSEGLAELRIFGLLPPAEIAREPYRLVYPHSVGTLHLCLSQIDTPLGCSAFGRNLWTACCAFCMHLLCVLTQSPANISLCCPKSQCMAYQLQASVGSVHGVLGRLHSA